MHQHLQTISRAIKKATRSSLEVEVAAHPGIRSMELPPLHDRVIPALVASMSSSDLRPLTARIIVAPVALGKVASSAVKIGSLEIRRCSKLETLESA